MKFSDLFKIEKSLQLDKRTLVTLRWIAIIGQLIAVNIVYFFLKLDFPIIESYVIILIGVITNIYLQFRIKEIQIKDFIAFKFLMYDLFQLSILLYYTGGISNPFTILLIIPAIVSSTLLSNMITIFLSILTLVCLFLLTIFHYPLPGIHEHNFTFPAYYLVGYFISIIIGLIFLSYFGIRFSGESKKRSDAVTKLEQIIAKEYELESLGGQAAAAAHSLGTPLATISVVAGELKKEIGENSNYTKDLDLLISQTKRCSEILKQISQKKIVEDKFFSSTKFEDLLNEIIENFEESSKKKIDLITDDDKNKIDLKRNAETIYGLRNFIGNAVKFAKNNINIHLKSNFNNIEVIIEDDGPGFPEDILPLVGEPYITSKSIDVKNFAGLGLGTFLGKTLLERSGAKLKFYNKNDNSGAEVSISWRTEDLRI